MVVYTCFGKIHHNAAFNWKIQNEYILGLHSIILSTLGETKSGRETSRFFSFPFVPVAPQKSSSSSSTSSFFSSVFIKKPLNSTWFSSLEISLCLSFFFFLSLSLSLTSTNYFFLMTSSSNPEERGALSLDEMREKLLVLSFFTNLSLLFENGITL